MMHDVANWLTYIAWLKYGALAALCLAAIAGVSWLYRRIRR
jgi:hypothetical protein